MNATTFRRNWRAGIRAQVDRACHVLRVQSLENKIQTKNFALGNKRVHLKKYYYVHILNKLHNEHSITTKYKTLAYHKTMLHAALRAT